MSIHKKWSNYTQKHVSGEPDSYGVFEIGDIDTGAVLYIGEGKIRTGLSTISPDGGKHSHVSLLGTSVFGNYGYRYEIITSREKAKNRCKELIKEFEKAYGSLPRFNQKRRRETIVSEGDY